MTDTMTSRWSRWARQLRRRHGRRERRNASGAMVLALRAGAITRTLLTTRRMIVQLLARVGVTLMPAPRTLVVRTAAPSPMPRGVLERWPSAPAPQTAHEGDAAPATSIAAEATLAVVRTPRLGATAERRHAVHVRHLHRRDVAERRAVVTHALVTHGRRAADGTRQRMSELPVLTGRRAVREELPIAPRPAVLARRTSEVEAAARSREPVDPEPTAARAPWAVPVVSPPIDVEALTGRVIQQLDRRLIAYRERMGRS